LIGLTSGASSPSAHEPVRVPHASKIRRQPPLEAPLTACISLALAALEAAENELVDESDLPAKRANE
jgi:hypothetical protein